MADRLREFSSTAALEQEARDHALVVAKGNQELGDLIETTTDPDLSAIGAEASFAAAEKWRAIAADPAMACLYYARYLTRRAADVSSHAMALLDGDDERGKV